MYGATISIFEIPEAAVIAAKAYQIESGEKYIIVTKAVETDNGMKLWYKPICESDLKEAKKDGWCYKETLKKEIK